MQPRHVNRLVIVKTSATRACTLNLNHRELGEDRAARVAGSTSSQHCSASSAPAIPASGDTFDALASR
jgi:hypothetical protein